jgi:hypothetical protein
MFGNVVTIFKVSLDKNTINIQHIDYVQDVYGTAPSLQPKFSMVKIYKNFAKWDAIIKCFYFY